MAFDDFLTHRATISTLKVGVGAAGDATRTPVVVADGVPCLVRPRSATFSAFQAAKDDARQSEIDSRIYFAGDPLAPGSALSTRHRIEVDGVAYAIVRVVDVHQRGEQLQVDALREGP